jgi:hypothetical protein
LVHLNSIRPIFSAAAAAALLLLLQLLTCQHLFAGVSVEGELLPRFLELLLQGPPVAAAAAGSGAGVLAAGVAMRLSEWRLQRQAQLLAVQEQLAELPYPLETLR